MPDVDFYTAAQVVTSDWIAAGVVVAVAFVLAHLLDRAIAKRGTKVGELVTRGELSPTATTRLRLIRRLVYALVIVIGFAIAAAQIPAVSSIATGVLASSAVLGLVIGFAARQTLANAIAGILLAITQPIRIGDLVTFEEQTGQVEDELGVINTAGYAGYFLGRVFIDGDFWHGRNWKALGPRLRARSNGSYWHAKILQNRARDRRITRELVRLGWDVLRLWETDVLRDPEAAATLVETHVRDHKP